MVIRQKRLTVQLICCLLLPLALSAQETADTVSGDGERTSYIIPFLVFKCPTPNAHRLLKCISYPCINTHPRYGSPDEGGIEVLSEWLVGGNDWVLLCVIGEVLSS